MFIQITGLLGTFTTVSIGYYMVYREGKSLGLCYVVEYPGIRRACVLDLTGGVMSILISVMILMVEFFSAYLNKNDVGCSDHIYLQLYHALTIRHLDQSHWAG